MSIFRSAVWDFTGKIVNQVIAFLVSVILARLLTPHEFGIIGITLAFVGFSNIFLDLGFKNAMIISQGNDKVLFSSILWLNLLIAFILTEVFYIGAPTIAEFFKEKEVSEVIRGAVVLFIINAFTLMPNAINLRALKFRELAVISIISSFISGGIAIWMAYTGWGVWSILARYIINALLTCIFNWFICKWVPVLVISWMELKKVWGYSARMFATTLMEIIVQKVDVLIMAKVYNTSTVGYYTRAQSLDNISRELTSGSMYSVFFPYFGRIKHEHEKVTELYLKSLHIITAVLAFLTGILFINATDLFILLFTEKWLVSAGLFQILTITGFFLTVTVVMNIVVAGIGKSKEFLNAEVIKKVIIVTAFAIGFMGGVNRFLIAVLVSSILGMLIMAFVVSKIANIKFLQQMRVILVYMVLGVCSALPMLYLFRHSEISLILRIVLSGSGFSLSFITLNALLGTQAYILAIQQLKRNVLKR